MYVRIQRKVGLTETVKVHICAVWLRQAHAGTRLCSACSTVLYIVEHSIQYERITLGYVTVCTCVLTMCTNASIA